MRRRRWGALGVLVLVLVTGCGVGGSADVATAPRCTSWERLGLIAQSVPSSAYVPCIAALPTGWRSTDLTVQNGSTQFDLVSDRAQGRAVRVQLRRRCTPRSPVPILPRTAGGRSYLVLRSIDPRYAGVMYDVFPGGCVSYGFDFQRGPHIALMSQLQNAVGFVTRAELSRQLRARLGVELRP
jgi:hypothetical protein